MSNRVVPATKDSFLKVDETNDAATALTYMRGLSDINEALDYPEAVKYLKRVQARASSHQYRSFIGVLEEFQEEIVKEIAERTEYVIKCAFALLHDHPDLLVGLADYIPDILDELEPEDRLRAIAQNRVPEAHAPWPHQDRSSIASDWQQLQAEASFHWDIINAKEARESFLFKVTKRFMNSDHTACVKIHAIVHAFLVNMTMDVAIAKDEMAPLLQHHNDLWKEFESFLPPALRSGSSSSSSSKPAPNLVPLGPGKSPNLPPKPPKPPRPPRRHPQSP